MERVAAEVVPIALVNGGAVCLVRLSIAQLDAYAAGAASSTELTGGTSLLPLTAQSIAWEVVGLATPGTAVAGQAAMLASRSLIAPSAGEPTGIAAIALTALVAPLLEYNSVIDRNVSGVAVFSVAVETTPAESTGIVPASRQSRSPSPCSPCS